MSENGYGLAPDGRPKGNKVWVDGCFDMVHFGHANQIRQSKQYGRCLIVGVHTDEEISLNKGPPVFTETERYAMVRAIRWVDEVVEGAPYTTTVETLDKHDCDFCLHGNDITLDAEGHDTYAEVKNEGRYRETLRTQGVSTSDLVGRMLLLTKTHHERDDHLSDEHSERARTLSTSEDTASPYTRVSRFVATSRTILEFASGRTPKPSDRIVYVCGAFDLFHYGHLRFLEEARKLGDYLICGILGDSTVNSYKGGNHPIMSLHERVLTVLAYRPVDEVVIGAPYMVSDEMIDRFNISLVVVGCEVPHHEHDCPDAFEAAKRRGIYREVESGSNLTTEGIIERIIKNRMEYEVRNRKKAKKEAAALEALERLQGDTTKAIKITAEAAERAEPTRKWV
ncbi:unnamed protein product, partial [Mesorhabditis belari]|uniref:ethanolamine-phosphate cytidylyltransferase n=1 Tax=Mesorhabditis belari TaxID=2138241 RepID=A0AAF3FI01_9BILA